MRNMQKPPEFGQQGQGQPPMPGGPPPGGPEAWARQRYAPPQQPQGMEGIGAMIREMRNRMGQQSGGMPQAPSAPMAGAGMAPDAQPTQQQAAQPMQQRQMPMQGMAGLGQAMGAGANKLAQVMALRRQAQAPSVPTQE